MLLIKSLQSLNDVEHFFDSELSALVGRDTQFIIPDLISKDDFIHQLIFDYFKFCYFHNAKPKSLSSLIGVDDDNRRRQINYQRPFVVAEYENSLRRLELEPTSYLDHLKKLTPGKQKGQFPSSTFTPPDLLMFENSACQSGLLIVRLFSNGAIAKTATKKEISAAYRDFQKHIQQAGKEQDSTKWLVNLYDLSSLENNTAPYFIYSVSDYMEQHQLTNVPATLMSLCGLVQLFPNMKVQARMLHKRHKLIPFFYSNEADIIFLQLIHLLELQGYMHAVSQSTNGLEDLATTVDDKCLADYFRQHYNLFSAFQFHDLSPEKGFSASQVKKMRLAYKTLLYVKEQKLKS